MASLVNWRDTRGSVVIQAVMVVAILVTVLYLSFEIWKIVTIQQSLQAATYQAAKYIALNGRYWGIRPIVWAEKVQPIVVGQLMGNPFARDSIRVGRNSPNPVITIWLNPLCNGDNFCDVCNFTVSVQLEHQVLIPPRYGESSGELLQLAFARRAESKLQCYP